MKRISIIALCLLAPAWANAAFYDTAYLGRLLGSCDALPETFEATAENFERIKDCGLSTGYILSVYDTLHVMADRSLCLPSSLAAEQAVAVVDTWIRNHPERAGNPAEESVRSALQAAWSCPN